MFELIKRAWRADDKGVAMAWFAVTAVLLLGTAGFAVDLGWLYLNASRVQRSADAAAMAGVTHLPGFPLSADLDARNTARANGFDVCDPGNTGCADTLTSTPLTDHQLNVEINTEVPSFFLAVLGFDSFGITRDATAEYIKPVPLGSPNNCFGRDPLSTHCADDPDGFWAAVSGPYTEREDGDPYSTNCFTPNVTATGCISFNNEYARAGSYGGYYFAIEVEPGSSDLTVRVFDAGMYPRPHDEQTGDGKWAPGANDPFGGTRYRFFYPDSTPQDPTDNPLVSGCDYNLAEGQWEGALRWKWGTLCTINGPLTPGIWVYHVETNGVGAGSNHYSLAAYTGAGPQPRVYGINDMSIWSNTLSSSSTDLHLVEVDPIHAGSKLELSFFDPGDAKDDSFMSVLDPFDNIPTCDWVALDYGLNVTESGNGACSWQTTDLSDDDDDGDIRNFNNQWIHALIDIPSDYTCNGSDCFWKMNLDLSDPNERTVWRARVIGNPIRLVP